jgi:ankyrin repeat protein
MSFLIDFANACDRDDLSLVESLLANGSIDANARLPRNGRPPALVLAARIGRKAIVDVLLRSGARIDDTDDDGLTACHVVAARGNAELLALLLARRPNLELTCKSGRTSLNDSFRRDEQHISMMLIEAGAPLEAVNRHLLCPLATSTSAIRTLLRRGVVVSDLRDQERSTPLHLAAIADRPDSAALLDLLVNECGVDLEARTVWGYTCTHTATIHGNTHALSFFLAAGASSQSVDNGNRTPLHLVRDAQCAILLLAAGADVHARDALERTPFVSASLRVNRNGGLVVVRSIVNVMLAAGADLDAMDRDDYSVRQILASRLPSFEGDSNQDETARREIAKVRLDFVRQRAWQVCIGLQSRGLDALQMCEILVHACGPLAPLIPFHQWWKIATTVKHFKS